MVAFRGLLHCWLRRASCPPASCFEPLARTKAVYETHFSGRLLLEHETSPVADYAIDSKLLIVLEALDKDLNPRAELILRRLRIIGAVRVVGMLPDVPPPRAREVSFNAANADAAQNSPIGGPIQNNR